MKKILEKHPKIKSRDVTTSDLKIVGEAAQELYRICFEPIGLYPGAMAMAHVQIEDNDPLRFFVLKCGAIIINPKIIGLFDMKKSQEGCMSFPNRKSINVSRYGSIDVEYIEGKVGYKIDMNNEKRERINGKLSFIFQHEIGHFDLNLIFKK